MFRYIKAMSYDRRTLETKLLAAVDPLTEHLIKLYLFPNAEYRNHWRKEVWSVLNKTAKLKGSNKFPPYAWIYNILKGYTDMTDDIMWGICQEYASMAPERYDSQEAQRALITYMQWISHQLSDHGLVTSAQVYAELDTLNL